MVCALPEYTNKLNSFVVSPFICKLAPPPRPFPHLASTLQEPEIRYVPTSLITMLSSFTVISLQVTGKTVFCLKVSK